MHFEVRKANHDIAVFAVSPDHGNDAALVAVFDHPGAAVIFAGIMNLAAKHYHEQESAKLNNLS